MSLCSACIMLWCFVSGCIVFLSSQYLLYCPVKYSIDLSSPLLLECHSPASVSRFLSWEFVYFVRLFSPSSSASLQAVESC